YSLDKNSLALTTNLDAFKSRAAMVIEMSQRPIRTDQDLATGKALLTTMSEAEKRLDDICDEVLGEITDVSSFINEVRAISEQIRQARLAAKREVDNSETTIRQKYIDDATAELDAHIVKLNERLGRAYMPTIDADFAGALKNKRTPDSKKNAIDTELAKAKIRANEIADNIQINVNALRDRAQEYRSLFPDVNQLVLKDPELVDATITARIAEHEKERQAAIDAAAQKARDDEQARIAAEAARVEREAQQQAAEPPAEPVADAEPVDPESRPSTQKVDPESRPTSDPAPLVLTVDNKLALIKAVADGQVSPDVLTVDMAVLQSLAELHATLPGVRISKGTPNE
ncbi:MAG: hypothetical protein CMJ75_19290, partial [Planctomycetaceae bacterium]|nr:hypothetical protein [Planctomycetaceae bacterium]